MDFVLEECPQIPYWPQLPKRDRREGMIEQAGREPILETGSASGYFEALKRFRSLKKRPEYFKGQFVGPWTLLSEVKDPRGKAAFFNEPLKQKLLTNLRAQARSQIAAIQSLEMQPIFVMDEPGIASVGTLQFEVSGDDLVAIWNNFVQEFQSMGAWVGIHGCSQEHLGLLLRSGADLVSFDAYRDLDRFIKENATALGAFMNRGGTLALGIVPTQAFDASVSAKRLADRVEIALLQIGNAGLDTQRVFDQTLITPSCGLGAVNEMIHTDIFRTCREVSTDLKRRFN